MVHFNQANATTCRYPLTTKLGFIGPSLGSLGDLFDLRTQGQFRNYMLDLASLLHNCRI